MKKNERSPVEKRFRRSLWLALPAALVTKAMIQDVARSDDYLTGGLILWGTLDTTVLIIALSTLKRDEILKRRFPGKALC